MDDFTIRVKKLPSDNMIGHNPKDLKLLLTQHFEKLIANENQKSQKQGNAPN